MLTNAMSEAMLTRPASHPGRGGNLCISCEKASHSQLAQNIPRATHRRFTIEWSAFSSRCRVSIQSAGMLQQLKSPGLGYNELIPGRLFNKPKKQEPRPSHKFFHFTYTSDSI